MQKVKGHKDLIKTEKNAVINTNVDDYQRYMNNRKLQLKRELEIKNLKEEVETLKNLVNKILTNE